MKMRNDPMNYGVDAESGIVFGMRGRPIIKRDGSGYIVVHRRDYADMLAHRVIWERVNGKIPDGLEINHINGIKGDNRISNLEAITHRQNVKHAYDIGMRRADGIHNGRSIGKRRQLKYMVGG